MPLGGRRAVLAADQPREPPAGSVNQAGGDLVADRRKRCKPGCRSRIEHHKMIIAIDQDPQRAVLEDLHESSLSRCLPSSLRQVAGFAIGPACRPGVKTIK